MKMKIFIIILVFCSFVGGMWYGEVSYKKSMDYYGKLQDIASRNSDYQVSSYEWNGEIDSLVKTLCKKEGIEYNTDIPTMGYLMSCPECITGGAFLQQESNGSIYYGFRHISSNVLTDRKKMESIDLLEEYRGQTYCGKCKYPVGTDWKIKALSS